MAIVFFIGMLSFHFRRPESVPGPPGMCQRSKGSFSVWWGLVYNNSNPRYSEVIPKQEIVDCH